MKKKVIYTIVAAALIIFAVFMHFATITVTGDEVNDGYVKSVISYAVYIVLSIFVIRFCGYNVFRLPKRFACFIIALAVAVNNFPFSPFIREEVVIVNRSFERIFWFIVNCFFTAAFEELFFRGVLFNFIVDCSACDKRGIIKSIIYSSLIFGAAHLLNLFVGAGVLPTLLQAGYTSLVGALCAFTLFKTRNIVFPWLVHAVYNVCGLILTTNAIGNGVTFDLTTVVVTAVIGVAVGVFVLISLVKTPKEECDNYRTTILNKKF